MMVLFLCPLELHYVVYYVYTTLLTFFLSGMAELGLCEFSLSTLYETVRYAKGQNRG